MRAVIAALDIPEKKLATFDSFSDLRKATTPYWQDKNNKKTSQL